MPAFSIECHSNQWNYNREFKGAQRENDTHKHKESSKRKYLRKAKLVWGTWIEGPGWNLPDLPNQEG